MDPSEHSLANLVGSGLGFPRTSLAQTSQIDATPIVDNAAADKVGADEIANGHYRHFASIEELENWAKDEAHLEPLNR